MTRTKEERLEEVKRILVEIGEEKSEDKKEEELKEIVELINKKRTFAEISDSSESELGDHKQKKPRLSAAFPDRGRTAVGPQVEHVSAYVLFEELVNSSVRGKKRSEATQAIVDSFKNLPLSTKAITEIAGETSIEKLQGFYDKDQRKENYEKVRKVLTGEGEFEKYRQAIKRSNHSILSEIGGKVRDICLFGSNKMGYTSLPIELKGGEKTENPNTGSEKQAKDNLKLLSNFIEDVEMIKSSAASLEQKQKDKGNEKKESILGNKELLTKLETRWGLSKESVEQLIGGGKNIDDFFTTSFDKEDKSTTIQEEIAKHIGELFYYERIEPDKLFDKDDEEWKKIAAKKYNKGTEPRDNNPEIMYQLAGRHLVLIMNCFKGLQQFNEDNKEQLMNKFLKQSLLKDGKWQEQEVDGKKLDLETVKEKVLDKSILNFGQNTYCTKDSEKGKNELQKQQQTATQILR